MIGFISKIGKPFLSRIKKLVNAFKTSDLENVKTADGENFKVQS
jgi:hypothetical protein